MKFTIEKKDAGTKARLGKIETTHSTFETPVFMPVGTRGTVKAVTGDQLTDLDTQIILGNTYHLMLKPGIDIIKKAGGLHAFARWPHSILTDSGGFQVFSLSNLNKITDQGVEFRSHIDGSRAFLGPVESMEIQKGLGSDIVMAFDECAPFPCEKNDLVAALERTTRWGKVCRDFPLSSHQSLFGIVQGGMDSELRERSASELRSLDFDGYAIGGLSVGEPAPLMYETLEKVEPHLPENKPRYLMGVGTPRNLLESVLRGVDMFDCVMPTRNARNGTMYTWKGKMNIKAGRYSEDFSPLDSELDSYASRFSKAYVRHLLNVDEITGLTLVTLQNIAFYLDFMRQLRQAIRDETVAEFTNKVEAIYPN